MKDASDFIKRVLLNKHVQIAAGKAWPNRGYDTYRDAHNAASKYHQNFDVRSFVVSRDPVVLVYYCLGRKFLPKVSVSINSVTEQCDKYRLPNGVTVSLELSVAMEIDKYRQIHCGC